ncbi:MAG: thymidine phosphorylase, partial [Clostridia bacterium]|nr:thymidine phosphorylase [Clostridia bacterium]
MTALDLILRKRDGLRHDPSEIAFLVRGAVESTIPDYQLSAWLMAVYFRGLDGLETTELAQAMARSGTQLNFSEWGLNVVDKHSTGGVGDKTTLVLAPLLASAGLPFAKLAGRGLGHTGGTIDKLEAIPGLRTDLEPDAFVRQVESVGVAVAAQTASFVPADAVLYALRDVTGTVDSIPLIAASIMSKKLAGGASVVVLDVKVGRGSLVPQKERALALAAAMLEIGARAGRRMAAVLSDMDQPLGYAVGNALEVREAIAVLQGAGPRDVRDLAVALGTQALLLSGRERSARRAAARLGRLLESGRALEKLAAMVEAQGGDPKVLADPERLPRAAVRVPVPAPTAGFVVSCDARAVGEVAAALGAGRRRKGEPVHPGVGVELTRKLG